MKYFLIITFLLTTSNVYAKSFNEAVLDIDKHSKLQSIEYQKDAVYYEGQSKSSWKDPNLKLSAVNFPIDNPEFGETPMSGLEVSLSQEIPLTSKFSQYEKSYNSKSKAVEASKEIAKRKLTYKLWELGAKKERLIEEKEILSQNMIWVKQMIKVSETQYKTGKVSQQATLDLKIRESEIKTEVKKREEQLKQVRQEFLKIIDQPESKEALNTNSIPWNYLDNYKMYQANIVPEEKLLKHQVDGSRYMSEAKNKAKVPDITVGLNYRYRDSFDDAGDFIGAFVSFPLQFGKRKSSEYSSANANRYAQEKKLKAFINELEPLKQTVLSEVEEFSSELDILNNETISFAETSRSITARRYEVGASDYIELLKSELQLQNLQLRAAKLKAKVKTKKAEFLLISGSPLTPETNYAKDK